MICVALVEESVTFFTEKEENKVAKDRVLQLYGLIFHAMRS